MNKKLIVFDLDGTLLNTLDDLAMAVNYALEQCKLPTHPIDSYKMMVGNGVDKLLERAMPLNVLDREMKEQMRYHFYRFYNDNSEQFTKPYDGILLLLEQLSNLKIQMGIASNKYQMATEQLVSNYFAPFSFCAVLGQRESVPIKPDPTVVLDIMNRVSCLPQEVLYVGDSGVDMLTAKRAGVDSIGVSWGFRSVDELKEYGAKDIIHTPIDLLQYIY